MAGTLVAGYKEVRRACFQGMLRRGCPPADKKCNAGKTGSFLLDYSLDRVTDGDTYRRDDGEDDDPGEYSGCPGELCRKADTCKWTGERGNKAGDDPGIECRCPTLFAGMRTRSSLPGIKNLYAIRYR